MDASHAQWIEDFEGNAVPYQQVVRGEGGWLTFADTPPCYEAVSGHSCLNFGHAHPELLEVIQDTYARLSYCSPEFASRESQAYAQQLSARLGGDYQIKYALSGASANEVAVSVARGYCSAKGHTDKHICLSLERSYHGQIGQAASLTGFKAFRDTRAAHAEIIHVDCAQDPETDKTRSLDDIAEQLIADIARIGAHRIACLIVEPVSFAGGVIVPPKGYLQRLRQICDAHEILLITDEIITGFGRSGAWFAFQHDGIRPDIVTMAKGITAGYFPLAAVATDARVFTALKSEKHALRKVMTMSGHPVGCALASKVLELIERDGLVAAVQDNETVIRDALTQLSSRTILREVRGRGHMWGLEFAATSQQSAPQIAARVAERCEAEHCIVAAADGIIRINPPLNMSADERDGMLRAISTAVTQVDTALACPQPT